MGYKFSIQIKDLSDTEKQIDILRPTLAQIKAAGGTEEPSKNGPYSKAEKLANMKYQCYACGTPLSNPDTDTQKIWVIQCPNPLCQKDQPSLQNLSWRKRDAIEYWRNHNEQEDDKGKSLHFGAANVARPPSPLKRVEGAGHPDPV